MHQNQSMCDVLYALELTARIARGALIDNANVIDQLSDKLAASETLRDQQAAQHNQMFTAATRKCDQLGAEIVQLRTESEKLLGNTAQRIAKASCIDDAGQRTKELQAIFDELTAQLPPVADETPADIRERALATLDKSGTAN